MLPKILSMIKSRKLIAWLIMIYLSLAWGSSFMLMDKALKVFQPEEIAALRIVLSALCLLPFILPHLKKLSRKDWITLGLVGLISNAIPAFLFPKAMQVVTSVTAGVLNSLSPLFTLLLGILFFGFRFPRIKVIGVLIGLGGAMLLVFFPASRTSTEGLAIEYPFWQYAAFAMLIVIATVCYAAGTNMIKKYLNKMPSLWVAGFALGIMMVPAAIYMLVTDLPATFEAKGSVAWEGLGYVFILAAFSTAIGVWAYSKLIQMTDPVFSSSVTYLIPVVAMLWGLVLKESINIYQIIGSLIILSGVYLVNKQR